MLGILVGYFLQIFVVLAGVWTLGILVEIVRMVWVDWRRAAYRYKLGMGPSPFAYTAEDFMVLPLAWPVRAILAFLDWLDRVFDLGDDDDLAPRA